MKGKDFDNINLSEYTAKPMAFNPVVELIIGRRHETDPAYGSGVVFDEGQRLVLTAAHCVVGGLGDPTFEIDWDVSAAYMYSLELFDDLEGYADVECYLACLNEDGEPEDAGHDWAVLRLGHSLHDSRYMQLSHASDATLEGREPVLKGYPRVRRNYHCNDIPDMQTKSPWGWWDDIRHTVVRYNLSAAGGSSGGPLASNPGSSTSSRRYVIAVHSGHWWAPCDKYYQRGPKISAWYSYIVGAVSGLGWT